LCTVAGDGGGFTEAGRAKKQVVLAANPAHGPARASGIFPKADDGVGISRDGTGAAAALGGRVPQRDVAQFGRPRKAFCALAIPGDSDGHSAVGVDSVTAAPAVVEGRAAVG